MDPSLEPSARCCDQQQQDPAVAAAPRGASEDTGGVLLYYKYIPLGEEGRTAVKDWYVEHCGVERLRGRVRVALDGVNCTLGGSLAALRRHIGSVEAHAALQGHDIDFKLASSRGARNSQAAQESGFTTLSVKEVKEVVTLGTRVSFFDISLPGRLHNRSVFLAKVPPHVKRRAVERLLAATITHKASHEFSFRRHTCFFSLPAATVSRSDHVFRCHLHTAVHKKVSHMIYTRTLRFQGAGLSHLEGGRHVSPQEFHRLLQEGAARNRQAHKVACGERGGRVSSGRESVAATAAAATAAAAASGGGGVVGLSSLDAPTPADDRGGDLAEATPTRRSGHGTVVARATKEGASTVSDGCAGAPAPVAALAVVGKKLRGGEADKRDKDLPGCSDGAGANAEDATVAEEKEAVLLDVRNVYETSIGRFR
ncbi:unnamed protein product [Ectocarpus sp. CCAP 1310/34]|nr:unnamed protein product [Ectocarpus sp. CCAP 1310/34]